MKIKILPTWYLASPLYKPESLSWYSWRRIFLDGYSCVRLVLWEALKQARDEKSQNSLKVKREGDRIYLFENENKKTILRTQLENFLMTSQERKRACIGAEKNCLGLHILRTWQGVLRVVVWHWWYRLNGLSHWLYGCWNYVHNFWEIKFHGGCFHSWWSNLSSHCIIFGKNPWVQKLENLLRI